jgi:two-component system NtrC family response regulator
VLIVDDEESIRFGMKACLEDLGYSVDCASERASAQVLLDAGHYAVVIADLRLRASRQTEGLELLSLVRATSPDTGTILLTAYGSPEAEREAHRIGVDAFLHKSQDVSVIVSAVNRLSQRSSSGA